MQSKTRVYCSNCKAEMGLVHDPEKAAKQLCRKCQREAAAKAAKPVDNKAVKPAEDK
jgi:ribosomal protein S14